jgi:hypothetical protein
MAIINNLPLGGSGYRLIDSGSVTVTAQYDTTTTAHTWKEIDVSNYSNDTLYMLRTRNRASSGRRWIGSDRVYYRGSSNAGVGAGGVSCYENNIGTNCLGGSYGVFFDVNSSSKLRVQSAYNTNVAVGVAGTYDYEIYEVESF